MNRSRILRADAMLLLLAMLWGYGFIAQKWAMLNIGPLTFVTIRSAAGNNRPSAIPVSGQTCCTSNQDTCPCLDTHTHRSHHRSVSGNMAAAGWPDDDGSRNRQFHHWTLCSSSRRCWGLAVGYYIRSLTWIAIIVAVIGLFPALRGRPTGSQYRGPACD